MNKIGDVKNKNILLLQGPMGDFFKKLGVFLEEKGANVYKIGFNLGDYYYHDKKNLYSFKGKPKEWKKYIKNFLTKNNIDKIILFSDCRFYHKIAIKEAKKRGIEVYVFEEGYVRPDFVTFEKFGVNHFSSIPRNPEFYYNLKDIKLNKKVKPANSSFFKRAKSAAIYYIIAYLGYPLYPNYRHHRELNPFKEFFYGLRSGYRKVKYSFLEKNKLEELKNLKYFFVPLQTYNDFQIRTHSDFKSIEKFIEYVMKSFSKNAPKEVFLVFKHHPMDRGRKDYKKYIYSLARELGMEKRVMVLYDVHLPSILKNTLGTVTINSTVGFQALYHSSPVKVLGRSIYDMEGLTDQKPLDEFWKDPKKPDKELYYRFRTYLINNSQINGSFYGYFDFESLIK